MKRQLIFRQFYYDFQELTRAKTISFFNETRDNYESVTTMTEDQAIKWLFNSFRFGQSFTADFFDNPQRVQSFFAKGEPFVINGRKPGDIDLILVDSERPDKAIAFECKRLKVTSMTRHFPK